MLTWKKDGVKKIIPTIGRKNGSIITIKNVKKHLINEITMSLTWKKEGVKKIIPTIGRKTSHLVEIFFNFLILI